MDGENRTGFFLMMGLVAFIVLFAVFFDQIAAMMTGGLFTALLVYYFSNPLNIIIIFFSVKYISTNKAKGLISGIILIIVSDIVGFNRLSPNGGEVGTLALTNSDSAVINAMMTQGLSYTMSWWVYYVVIPVGLVLLMCAILGGFAQFKKRVTKVA